MTINFRELAAQLVLKFGKLDPYDRYKWFLSQYFLAGYKLGKENFRLTDCSGILSGALFLAGFNIRATADFFFQHIFQIPFPEYTHRLHYRAVFIVDRASMEATHVCPHIENGVYLDVTDRVELVTYDDIVKRHVNQKAMSYDMYAEEKTLSAYSVSLLASTDIDDEIAALIRS